MRVERDPMGKQRLLCFGVLELRTEPRSDVGITDAFKGSSAILQPVILQFRGKHLPGQCTSGYHCARWNMCGEKPCTAIVW